MLCCPQQPNPSEKLKLGKKNGWEKPQFCCSDWVLLREMVERKRKRKKKKKPPNFVLWMPGALKIVENKPPDPTFGNFT